MPNVQLNWTVYSSLSEGEAFVLHLLSTLAQTRAELRQPVNIVLGV